MDADGGVIAELSQQVAPAAASLSHDRPRLWADRVLARKEQAVNHAVTQPFSIVWTNSGDEQLTVDGLRSLVRQLPGVLVYLDAAGAPIIGCVTAAANIGSATVQIDGETRVPVPDGANVRAQYRLRRAAVLSGVVMVSALDSVSILVTICDVSEVATADSTKTEADAAPGVDAS